MKKSNKQLVSVVITNYNYAQYLAESLTSVTSQTYKNLQIIVIDDGSLDRSSEIIESFAKKDARIEFIKQANKGVVSARNLGIEKSKGEYLMFFDADDKLPDNYIDNQLKYMLDNDLDIAYVDFKEFGLSDNEIVFPEYKLDIMKNGNIIGITSLIKRSIIGNNRFDETFNRRSHEDWDFFLGLALKKVVIKKNPNVKLLYRKHSVSRNNIEDSFGEKMEFAEVFRDILDKYSKDYNEEFYYMKAIDFSNQLATLYRIVLPEKDKEFEELKLKYETLKNSRDYAIGKTLLKVPRKVKKIVKEAE